jgi:hypothetical protein
MFTVHENSERNQRVRFWPGSSVWPLGYGRATKQLPLAARPPQPRPTKQRNSGEKPEPAARNERKPECDLLLRSVHEVRL